MSPTIAFSLADRGGGNLLLDILCDNIEPIALSQKTFNLILALGSLQCELYGRQFVGCNSLFARETNFAPFEG